MKHASTRALFNYWNEKRGHRLAPERADINPTDIRNILGDAVLLAADFADEIRFRLAGTRVCALFAREIKGEAFASLWTEESQKAIEGMLAGLAEENVGAVAGVVARAEDGAEAELELLVLPLAHAGQTRIRGLGSLAALSRPFWLGDQPVVELELRTLRHIGVQHLETQTPRFGQKHNALRRGFLVYSGGRREPSSEQAG